MLDPNKIEDLQSIEKCRNIAQEILRFGVNEAEIQKVIKILSLELEDTTLMRNIQEAFKNKENDSEEKEKPKLLLQ
tara:strand:- start:101 stop:328 length:228 start_codon:yes stop_codon:yes gene_type:complete